MHINIYEPASVHSLTVAGLYRKIVSYILLRSGLGSPTEIAVVREATGIVKCVLPHSLGQTFLHKQCAHYPGIGYKTVAPADSTLITGMISLGLGLVIEDESP